MEKGDVFSREFVVDGSIYQGFVSLFNDRNPLHTDNGYAAAKGFRSAVMHGNILNGFLSYFVGECLPLKNVVIHSQEIRYHHPVYLNDRLLLTATVKDKFESVSAVEFSFYFENQQRIKIAKGKVQIGIV